MTYVSFGQYGSISHFINIFPNMHHHVQALTYSIQESTFLNYHHGCGPLTIGIGQCKFAIFHKGHQKNQIVTLRDTDENMLLHITAW